MLHSGYSSLVLSIFQFLTFKVESLEDPVAPCASILAKCPENALKVGRRLCHFFFWVDFSSQLFSRIFFSLPFYTYHTIYQILSDGIALSLSGLLFFTCSLFSHFTELQLKPPRFLHSWLLWPEAKEESRRFAPPLFQYIVSFNLPFACNGYPDRCFISFIKALPPPIAFVWVWGGGIVEHYQYSMLGKHVESYVHRVVRQMIGWINILL